MDAAARTESVMTCTACGASIYQEHIDRGLAGMWAGEMLCPSCLRERRETDEVREEPDEPVFLPLMDGAASANDQDEIEEAEPPRFSIAQVLGPAGETETPSPRAGGARRVRIFHAKLSEGAVRHLEEQINTWLDSDPRIHVKFATTTVGVWEAKHAEANLILSLFY